MFTHLPNTFKLAKDDEIEMVRDAAMKILCNSGFRIENRVILEQAEAKGLKVDYTRQWVEVTPEIFTSLEKAARLHAWEALPVDVVRRPISKGYGIGRDMVRHIDWAAKTSHQATLIDNINLMKAGHMLSEVNSVAPLHTASDIPFEIEPIVCKAEAIKITDKPFKDIGIMTGKHLPYLEELETIKTGMQTHITYSFASIARFALDRMAASCLEAVWKRNGLKKWGTNSCPFAGLNAPVTVAGSAAVAMAEMIGGWLPAWVLNEDVIFFCTPVSATVDFRNTRPMFSTPQAILTDALLFQVFDRLYGIKNDTACSATYVDGKVPGMQALHDKVFKTLALFSFSGCQVGIHFGMLEAGSSICPAQMILDFELNQELEQLVRGMEINEQTLGLDTVLEIGIHKDFLTANHTLEHYRQSLWHSQLFDCTTFADTVDEIRKDREVIDKAQHKYEKALASYEPINLDAAKLGAVDAVVAAAKLELLG